MLISTHEIDLSRTSPLVEPRSSIGKKCKEIADSFDRHDLHGPLKTEKIIRTPATGEAWSTPVGVIDY
jgi:hypothetical protein